MGRAETQTVRYMAGKGREIVILLWIYNNRGLALFKALFVNADTLPTKSISYRSSKRQRQNKPTSTKMISSAFARSRPLMARHDVSPHLTKWWKGVRPDDGQVSLIFFLAIRGFVGVAGGCQGLWVWDETVNERMELIDRVLSWWDR